jgi:hypothetical protein
MTSPETRCYCTRQPTATEVHLLEVTPEAENTPLLYRQRVVVDKLVNLKPTAGSFACVR